MTNNPKVIKSTYYSNWSDIFGYPLAFSITNKIKRIKFLTPNMVTLIAFSLFSFGSISLFLDYSYHLFLAAFFIFAGYIGDDIDGQLARARNMQSKTGDFLDKVLDVFKIFIISSSASYKAFLDTGNFYFIFLGMSAGFLFMIRYYIKLETMFSRINADPAYLEKSAEVRIKKEEEIIQKTKDFSLKALIIKHRIFFWMDEAEIALIIAFSALIDKVALGILFLAITQFIITLWRFFERLNQIKSDSERLLWPLRK